MRQIFKILLSIGSAFTVTIAVCIATTMLFITPLSDTFTLLVSLVTSLTVVYPVVDFYKKRFAELFDATFPIDENK